ncbi:MAG: hypothetical protein HY238_12580 [Acidobacteria bacterium]|nr:hypothetical protein [Acidobacteriota bacterium]
MMGLESTNGGSTAMELRSWLEGHDWQPGRLIDWMQGYELPTSPFEDQPYLLFLQSLPGGAERTKLARELARRVGKVLAAPPDEQPRADRPNQVLYNLFMLAGNL